MVPKNMTHLQQSLNLTTNASFKKNEKWAFSEYFMSCIMETLTNDPDRDVTTIQVDLRLSILKPRNARVMTDIYQYLKSQRRNEIIKAGWRATGITDVLKDSREGSENTIRLNRSSRLEVFCEKGVLRNFAKFTGKHLCQSLFFNKVAGLWHRCFPVNFAKFLRTPFFTEHFWWLLSAKPFCMIGTVYILYTIIKKFLQIDLKFVCYFFLFFPVLNLNVFH